MGDTDLLTLVLRAGVGAVIIYVVYRCLYGRNVVFVVWLRKGRVHHKGAFSLFQKAALAQLLLCDLGVRGPLKIIGHREGKRLSIAFRGKLSAGDQQRIRNMLLTQR